MSLFQSGGTRNNFNQLSGDDSLTCSVECQRQLVNHLASVLGSVVHGSHSWRLLRARAFFHRVEKHWSHWELQVALDDIGIQWVVDWQLSCCFDWLQAEDGQVCDLVWHDRLEFVVDDLAIGEIVAAVDDFVGQLGGIQELWWQTSNLKLCYAISCDNGEGMNSNEPLGRPSWCSWRASAARLHGFCHQRKWPWCWDQQPNRHECDVRHQYV